MATSNPIELLLNKTIPEKLWHYTSIQGFHGIVTSKTIFATDVRFLNDLEELTHARKIANELVEETADPDPEDFPVKSLLRDVFDQAFNAGILHPSRVQVFVASFSSAEDQLSQWRGYSSGSSGVSLAFDLRDLRALRPLEPLAQFAPCVYTAAEKKALLSYAVQEIVEETKRFSATAIDAVRKHKGPLDSSDKMVVSTEILKIAGSTGFTERLNAVIWRMAGNLLGVAALLKNASFEEEQEWRLVIPLLMEQEVEHPLRFRSSNTALIPYLALSISAEAATLPLVDVILGPGSDANSTHSALAFLKSADLKGVLPRTSKIPYRPR